mmetsp:Transcript_11665/g.28261  ORF Transcript_11665/g.28261 Transcript_11665/m.28261 type:complete len:304 (-) Transcript_11665:1159-2070(-)
MLERSVHSVHVHTLRRCGCLVGKYVWPCAKLATGSMPTLTLPHVCRDCTTKPLCVATVPAAGMRGIMFRHPGPRMISFRAACLLPHVIHAPHGHGCVAPRTAQPRRHLCVAPIHDPDVERHPDALALLFVHHAAGAVRRDEQVRGGARGHGSKPRNWSTQSYHVHVAHESAEAPRGNWSTQSYHVHVAHESAEAPRGDELIDNANLRAPPEGVIGVLHAEHADVPLACKLQHRGVHGAHNDGSGLFNPAHARVHDPVLHELRVVLVDKRHHHRGGVTVQTQQCVLQRVALAGPPPVRHGHGIR